MGPLSSGRLWSSLLLVVTLLAYSVVAVRVSGLTPATGSRAGGTYLTIRGAGFLLTGPGEDGFLRVFVGAKVCNAIEYYTSDSSLVCVTTPGFDENGPLQVRVAVLTVASFTFASGPELFFEYTDARTPLVSSLTRGVSQDGLINVCGGDLRKQPIDSYEMRFGEYLCDLNLSQRVDPSERTLNDDFFDSTIWRGDPRSQSVYCALDGSLPAGRHNFSMWVDGEEGGSDGYGFARFERDAVQVDLLGNLFGVTQFPTIESVSHHTGGLSGGEFVLLNWKTPTDPRESYGPSSGRITHEDGDRFSFGDVTATVMTSPTDVLEVSSHSDTDHPFLSGKPNTLSNAGFDPANSSRVGVIGGRSGIHVRIAGSECAVVQADENGVICRRGPVNEAYLASREVFPGGRGLLREVWHDVQNWGERAFTDNPHYPDLPTSVGVQTDALDGVGESFGDFYAQQLSGFFRPPMSANYSFWIACDDWCEVLLSHNESASGLERIAHASRWTNVRDYWALGAEQRSHFVHLTAGERYFFRVRHSEGAWHDHLNVAMRISGGDGNLTLPVLEDRNSENFNNHASYSSVPEIQRIHIEVDVRYEIQSFNVTGANRGTFRLRMGALTGSNNLQWNATTSEVDAEITSSLREEHDCWHIYVSRHSIEGGHKWTVTFRCMWVSSTLRRRPLLQVLNTGLRWTSPDGVAPMGVVSFGSQHEQDPSEPVDGTFRLGFGSFVSTLIPFDSSDLAALRNIDDLDYIVVTVAGSAREGLTWTIKFYAPAYGDQPEISINSTGLTGENITAFVETVQNGSLDYLVDPVTMDYFETAHENPQVELYENGFKAACSSLNCDFVPRASLTPRVYNATPSVVQKGTALTVYGSMLLERNGTLPRVYLGDDRCKILSVSQLGDVVQCTVPDLSHGTLAVEVLVHGLGTARNSSVHVEYGIHVDSVTPSGGSGAGGTIVTLEGAGFHPNGSSNITIGDAPCTSILSLPLFTDFASSNLFSINSSNGTQYTGLAALSLLETSHTVFVCVTSSALEPVPFTTPIPAPVPFPAPIPAPVPAPGLLDIKMTHPLSMSRRQQLASAHELLEEAYIVSSTMHATRHASLLDFFRPLSRKMYSYSEVIHSATGETLTNVELSAVPAPHPVDTSDSVALLMAVDGMNTTHNFTYSGELTPVVTFVTPESASTSVTNVFTIHGSGFVHEDVNTTQGVPHRVTFEGRVCEINNVTNATIVCTLPRGESFHTSLVAPAVWVHQRGLASTTSVYVRLGFSITSLSHYSSSLGGGLSLRINGFGFNHHASVTISLNRTEDATEENVFDCAIVDIVESVITCVTPAVAEEHHGTHNMTNVSLTGRVNVHQNMHVAACNDEVGRCEHTFLSSITPMIHDVSPLSASAGNTITITGTRLSQETTTISLGGVSCGIVANMTTGSPATPTPDLAAIIHGMFSLLERSPAKDVDEPDRRKDNEHNGDSSTLHCVVGQIFAGRHRLDVFVDDVGLAIRVEAVPLFVDILPTLVSISRATGSIAGGTRVTLHGTGFHRDPSSNVVAFGSADFAEPFARPARVVSASHTEIVVETPLVFTKVFENRTVNVSISVRSLLDDGGISMAHCSDSDSHSGTHSHTSSELLSLPDALAPSSHRHGKSQKVRAQKLGSMATKTRASRTRIETKYVTKARALHRIRIDISKIGYVNDNSFIRPERPHVPMWFHSGTATLSNLQELLEYGASDIEGDSGNATPSNPLKLLDTVHSDAEDIDGYGCSESSGTLSCPNRECADCAQFEYSIALTPILSSIQSSGDTVISGDTLTVVGTGFQSAMPSDSHTFVGGVECSINQSTWNDTHFECTVGDAPAGSHIVRVVIGGGRGDAYWPLVGTPQESEIGFAPNFSATQLETLRVNVGVEFSEIDNNFGGYGGDSIITINGHGFPSNQKQTLVDLPSCNASCEVISSSYREIQCRVPEVRTVELVRHMINASVGAFGDQLLSGTPFGEAIVNASSAFDGNFNTKTLTTSTGSPSTIGLDFGEHRRAVLERVRFYPAFGRASTLRGSIVQGSVDGTNFEEIAVIDDPREAWNVLTPSGIFSTFPRGIRYLRILCAAVGDEASRCEFIEIEFIGHMVSAAESHRIGDDLVTVCNMTVSFLTRASVEDVTNLSDTDLFSVAPKTNVTIGAFAFSLNRTSRIVDMSPRFGTARGGTEVVLTRDDGEHAATLGTEVEVIFNGIECNVTLVTNTEIRCITSPRAEIMSPSLTVLFEGGGYAMVDATLRWRYIDRWSDRETWLNNEPPQEGDSVVVPDGQAILVDISPPELFLVLVQGDMAFDPSVEHLELDASYILIQGGRFEVGTEDEPYAGRATITLHGDRRDSVEIPHIGSKVLAVMNSGRLVHSHGASHEHGADHARGSDFREGFLDIHGEVRKRVWTKVAETAPAGATQIISSEDVDYRQGDRIVISSNSDPGQSEEHVVVSLAADNRTITVDEPLRFTHESFVWEPEALPGVRVDMRCEVGLLSRSVVIRGDDDSFSQMFGAHTLAAHGGTYRIENAEVTDCGQAFNLGRYCIHYHMAGPQQKSYVRSNSIHQSFQRAVTVHGSHHVRVKHNFAYNVMGHTYFVEDGVETKNVFEENLGVLTLASSALLKSDNSPATFWTASPDNIWRHNVAAGSSSHGFWFELPGNPGGPSATTEVCPRHERVGEFFNNTAHSNAAMGLRVYPNWTPREDPCDGTSGSAPQYLYNFTSYRNGGRGVFHKLAGDLHHINYQLVENRGDAAFFWTKLEEVDFEWDAHIQDILVVHSTDPPGESSPSRRGIFGPQNEDFFVSGATFVNFGDSGVLAGCADCTVGSSLKQGAFTFRWENLQFINSSVRIEWTRPFKQIMWDVDGTLTGTANSTVTKYYDFLEHSTDCVATNATWSFGVHCSPAAPLRRVRFDRIQPRQLRWLDILPKRPNSSPRDSGAVPYLPLEFSGWAVPLAANNEYNITWGFEEIDFQHMRVRYGYTPLLQHAPPETGGREWLMVNFPHTDYRDHFNVTYRGGDVAPVDRVPLPTDPMGSSFYDRNGTNFQLMMTSLNYSDFEIGLDSAFQIFVQADQCPVGGCPIPERPSLGNPKLWSDPDTWAPDPVPAMGDDVYIDSTTYIVLDIATPPLGTVNVFGRLEFLDAENVSITAKSIVVWGEMHVGDATRPYTNRTSITLTGVRTDPTPIIDSELFLGNKVLVVVGNLSLYATPINITWTTLGATANAGDSMIRVSDPVAGWRPGDEIAISPTGYDATELERATIAEVSPDGRLITLASPLQYRHYGEVLSIDGREVTIAAAVGLLSRGIVFQSEFDAAEPDWGAYVQVGEAPSSAFVGTSTIGYIEFRQAGKANNVYPALGYHYAGSTPENKVVGCSFVDGLNNAILAENTPNLVLSDNVIFGTYRSAISIDSESASPTLTNNLIMDVKRSLDVVAQAEWVRPVAGVVLGARAKEMSDNFVGGSESFGYIVHGDTCDGSPTMTGNVVHSAMVGIAVIGEKRLDSCAKLVEFVAFKCSHIGIMTIDQRAEKFSLESVVTASCHIGTLMNFLGSGTYEVTVRDSVIIGAPPSLSSCDDSAECRTTTEIDFVGTQCNSVYGGSHRFVGIALPQFTDRARTCGGANDGNFDCDPPITPYRLCSMPWGNRYGLPNLQYASLSIRNTSFLHFRHDDCGSLRSAAIAWNPTQIDYAPDITISEVTFPDSDREAFFDFGSSCRGTLTSCDGRDLIVVHDEDGSVTEEPGGIIMADNPTIAVSQCTTEASWHGFVCENFTLVQALFENLNSDRTSRHIGPLRVSRLGDDARESFSRGPFDDGCALSFHRGRFTTYLQPHQIYDIEFTGTLPPRAGVAFFSDDARESVVARIFHSQPLVILVRVDGTLVAELVNGTFPTLLSTAGANQLDPQERVFHLTLRGDSGPYRTETIAVVAVTVTLDMELDDFNEEDFIGNLALLLEIDEDRIKIVSVTAGSVNLEALILPEVGNLTNANNQTDGNETSSEAQEQRYEEQLVEVQALGEFLASALAVNSSVLGANATSLSLNVTTAPENASATPVPTWSPTSLPTPSPTGPPTLVPTSSGENNDVVPDTTGSIRPDNDSSSAVAASFGGIAAVVVLFALYRCYKRRGSGSIGPDSHLRSLTHVQSQAHPTAADSETTILPDNANNHVVSQISTFGSRSAPADAYSPQRLSRVARAPEENLPQVTRAPAEDTSDIPRAPPEVVRIPEDASMNPRAPSVLQRMGSLGSSIALSFRRTSSYRRAFADPAPPQPRVPRDSMAALLANSAAQPGRYSAIGEHQPASGDTDEIAFVAGDMLWIVDTSSATWFVGYSFRTGKSGAVPRSKVRYHLNQTLAISEQRALAQSGIGASSTT